MKKFVCKEHGEIFIVSADSLEEAQESAELWGGEAFRELTPAEYASHDGKGGYNIKM
jgi:hypothetical protein